MTRKGVCVYSTGSRDHGRDVLCVLAVGELDHSHAFRVGHVPEISPAPLSPIQAGKAPYLPEGPAANV